MTSVHLHKFVGTLYYTLIFIEFANRTSDTDQKGPFEILCLKFRSLVSGELILLYY